jgi:hypothetical protein
MDFESKQLKFDKFLEFVASIHVYILDVVLLIYTLNMNNSSWFDLNSSFEIKSTTRGMNFKSLMKVCQKVILKLERTFTMFLFIL